MCHCETKSARSSSAYAHYKLKKLTKHFKGQLASASLLQKASEMQRTVWMLVCRHFSWFAYIHNDKLPNTSKTQFWDHHCHSSSEVMGNRLHVNKMGRSARGTQKVHVLGDFEICVNQLEGVLNGIVVANDQVVQVRIYRRG